jgi:hypothetical protein
MGLVGQKNGFNISTASTNCRKSNVNETMRGMKIIARDAQQAIRPNLQRGR